jgi:hypothetical protein
LTLSSKTAKPKEKDLYAPYKQRLKEIFDSSYVDKGYVYTDGLQSGISSGITNPHLEITADGVMSEELQRIFDYPLFADLYGENLKPDIMGFVRRNDKSEAEIITVEVKAGALTIRDVLQAKMYSDIFNAKHAFAISPEGISIPKLQTILRHDTALRGNVIIVRWNPFDKWNMFRIYKELKSFVPKEFHLFCG